MTGTPEWAAYTPEGKVQLSPAVAPYLRWRVGDDLLTFEKFAAQGYAALPATVKATP